MTKTALITGVSSGIGRMTAELMLRRGWNVAATSRDASSLDVRDERFAAWTVDVTDDVALKTAIETAAQRFGRIDVLVNNAGYGVFGPLEGTSTEEVDRQFRTNVTAAINAIRHVMPIMRAQGGGTIINLSSIAGRIASPMASLYHASKFAIEGFSESFRYEAALHNVRVKLIEPEHFQTGFISRSLKTTSHPAYEIAFNNYMQWVHEEDRKAPTPEPVAEAIVRAAEDTSVRLRYPVKGALILALAKLLPDAMWRSLMAEGMKRTPKQRR